MTTKVRFPAGLERRLKRQGGCLQEGRPGRQVVVCDEFREVVDDSPARLVE